MSPFVYSRALSVWLMLAALSLSGCAPNGGLTPAEPPPGHAAHWSYDDKTGPQHWGSLSPEFAICASGKNQSPIDITGALSAELAPLRIDLQGWTAAIVNNGHTVQVDVGLGNALYVEGHRYEMEQFHFHSPSEHLIDGERFALEGHFVHRDAEGTAAVLSVLFRSGDIDPGLLRLGAAIPDAVGERVEFHELFADFNLIPDDLSYFRYNGSLTTPPCTEGITWLILKTTDTLSSEQVKRFVGLIGEDARGSQPVNGRLILE